MRNALDNWLDPKRTLLSRAAFVSSFNSPTDQCILNDFYDVVFGISYQNRDRLLGSSGESATYNRGQREILYKQQGLNFRSLLLSCFKQHGGADPESEFLYEQDVVFVDISRMSAADILTIHGKLALLKQFLRPGEEGTPRHIIVSGDQPTYKMIVKIWRESYSEGQRNSGSNAEYGELKVHEWLIPFPGFFHVEKQSLYPLCKEMLHGLGLTELAECAGLSLSQVQNILKHSHARNNRSLLFSICGALIIHTSDLIQAECPDLKDSLQEVLSNTASRDASSTRSKLLKCTTDTVTNDTMQLG